MENSALSLVPPIVTIGLAIATKRIFLALGIGVALGTLMDHVTTQLPYALLCALASTIGYVVLGFTKSTVFGLVTALASLAFLVFLLKGRFSDRELHESRVEREASMA